MFPLKFEAFEALRVARYVHERKRLVQGHASEVVGCFADSETVRARFNVFSLFLGYVNEVGEAFRIIIGPKFVSLSYLIATLYSVADACDKAYKEYKVNVFFVCVCVSVSRV